MDSQDIASNVHQGVLVAKQNLPGYQFVVVAVKPMEGSTDITVVSDFDPEVTQEVLAMASTSTGEPQEEGFLTTN